VPAPFTHTPVVSIVMATYNFERFLARAVESALAQDYPADALDIVVVDDGSTDSTPRVMRPYLDRVKYIRKENGGLLTTVNRGLAEARGEFISLLSGDDEFLPDKTRAQVEFLLEHPEVGMVYADLEVVDDHGQTLHPSLWRAGNLTQVRGRAFGPLLTKNVVSGGAMMFRSSLKPHFHPLPDTAAWEDWYISLKIASVAEIDYIPQAVYRYRYHGDNMNLGAKGPKMAALLREELKFRRSLLAELEPGLVTVAELMSGWTAFNGTVTTLAQMTGEAIEELILVSDEHRASAREAVAAARLALAAGDRDAGVFMLVNAIAEDPWNQDAQADLARALEAPSAAPAPALDGVRAFATLAFAGELVAAPEMLTAYATCFSGGDDATLAVFGSAEEIEALGGALDAAGLGDEDGPDMLAVTDGDPQALAGSVRAVYSRRPQEGELASRPRVDDGRVAVLRDLAAETPASAQLS
jgi:glycosyltransferase involved in cell wall biosynthesis